MVLKRKACEPYDGSRLSTESWVCLFIYRSCKYTSTQKIRDCFFHSHILIHFHSNSDDEQSALQEAYSERVKEMVSHEKDEFYVSWLGLFMQVASWMMFALGAIYMMFSLCCLKRLRDKLTQEHRRKCRQYEDAKRIRQHLNQ